MGLINWNFDFYQQSRIEDLQDEAARARADVAAMRTSGGGIDAARLEQARDELQRKMYEIDLEDGRADGKSPLH